MLPDLRDEAYLSDSEDKLSGMWLAGSSDEVDHLVMSMLGHITAIDHDNLVALVESRIAPEKVDHNHHQKLCTVDYFVVFLLNLKAIVA